MKRILFLLLISIFLFACSPTLAETETAPVPTIVESPTRIVTPDGQILDEHGNPTAIPVESESSQVASAPVASETTQPTETPVIPDLVVKNIREFDNAVGPYCFGYTGLTDDLVERNKMVRATATYQDLSKLIDAKEILAIGIGWMPKADGSVCAKMMLVDFDQKVTSAYFQSMYNPEKWIRVKFTEPTLR